LAQLLGLSIQIPGVEEKVPGELFLHVRHDFQGPIVAVQENTEVLKPIPEARLFVFFIFQETPQESKHR
jgi:hypothetical protein